MTWFDALWRDISTLIFFIFITSALETTPSSLSNSFSSSSCFATLTLSSFQSCVYQTRACGPIANISLSSPSSFDTAKMHVGQLASSRDRFCPIGAVTKWPYRHLHNKEESEKVSIKFFADGQFRSRGWTMWVNMVLFRYFLHPSLGLSPLQITGYHIQRIHYQVTQFTDEWVCLTQFHWHIT